MVIRSLFQSGRSRAFIEPLESRIAPAFGAVVDLSALFVGGGIRLDGAAPGDGVGFSVAEAGDVNNDGFGDFIIGAPTADESGADSGAAYVIFGRAGGVPASVVLPPASVTDGFKIKGAAASDLLGTSVSGAGDVNNDGFDDVIVGAPGANGAGAAYVIFGASTPPLVVSVTGLNGANGFKIAGDGAGQLFGSSVSRLGDVHGDGFDDVVIGAPGDNDYGTDAGAAYVIFGGGTFGATINVAALSGNGSKLAGDVASDLLGTSVAAAGDVNKDGKADIIVGAPGRDPNGANSGSAFVIYGSASLPNYFAAATIGGPTGFEIRGPSAGSRAGTSVGGVGDINQDSFADVVVGAPNADGSGFAGSTFVVFGGAAVGAQVQIAGLNGSNGFKIPGLTGTDRFGTSVAGAGDVNGDGISDLIAGAFKADSATGSQAGAAYVIYGTTAGFGATVNPSTLNGANGFQITGGAAGDLVGRSVSAAGDVDGDGIRDFIVGASGSGSAYVIYGQPLTDIDISVVAGTVVVEDTFGADSNASLRLIQSGTNLRISDPNAILRALAGATQIDSHTVQIPLTSITGLIGIDAGRGDDAVYLDHSGGPIAGAPVAIIGGDGTDAIFLEGDSPASVILGVTDSNGVLSFDSVNVTFDTTESVTDLRAVGSRTFAVTDDTDYALSVSDHGSGVTDIASTSGFLYRFASPANLLSISGGDGGDLIAIQSYDAQPGSDLLLVGGAGSDVVKILAPIRINRLDIDAENVDPLPSLTIGLGGAVWQSGAVPFSFANGARLGLAVAGSEVFLSYSVVTVTGAVDLTGVALRLDGSVSGPVSQPVALIYNDGSDAITGTFAGLPEGAGVMLGTVPYVISYVGGDGNDVTLTRRIAFGSSLLGDLNGANGFIIPGPPDDAKLGSAVSALGDVNGDGFDDFAVTAPRAPGSAGNGNDAGVTYVFFGKDTPFNVLLDVGLLDGTNGFVIRGVDGGDLSGVSVSGGGDINGDGLADILIGASVADPVDGDYGAAYVVFGSTAAFDPELALSALDGTNGFRFDGQSDGDFFGFAVNASGDINGDGITDLVIGAPNAGADSKGRAYVLFGSRLPFPAAVAESLLNGTNGFIIDGEGGSLADFGAAVSTVDVNGDGFDDVVVGAPSFTDPSDVYGVFKGAAYVVFGTPTQKSSTTSVTTLNGKNGFKVLGEQAFSSLGFAVSGAGDLNNDGIDDLVVGAPGRDGFSVVGQPGSAYVVFGKTKGWSPLIDVGTLNGANGFEIVGAETFDFAGASVGSVGDFNGDGIADIIVGAPGSDASGNNKGAAHVIFGRNGFAPQMGLANINGTNGYSFLGSVSGERAGSAVAGISDINRDGLADIAIGSPVFGDDGSTQGQAYVIFGREAIHPMPLIQPGGASASFLDVDGDEIIVKVAGGKVNADMFTFSAAGDLLLVDLNAGGTIKRGANITFLVKQRGGNGTLDVGAIVGTGLNLGKISVTGDLGQIDITPLNPLKPVLKQLVVGSFGMVGEANQIPGTIDPLVSDIGGSLTKLIVRRDVHFATLNIEGALGNMSVGGNFDGTGAFDATQLAALGHAVSNVAGGSTLANSGLSAASIGNLNIKQSLNNAAVRSDGNIGNATIGGSVNRGAIVAGGNIRVVNVFDSITSDDIAVPSVIAALGKLDPKNAAAAVAINAFTVRNDVRNAEILIGYTSDFVATNPDASIGKVTVKRDWIASSLAVGIADSGNDGFGRNDTVIPEAIVDTILARIASITITGTATGSLAGDDSFAIAAQQIAKAKISGQKVVLDKLLPDDILVPGTDDFRIKEISL